MAPWLRAFTAVVEDLGSTPSLHLVAHNHESCQLQRIGRPLLISAGTAVTWYADINVANLPIHIKNTLKILLIKPTSWEKKKDGEKEEREEGGMRS